MTIEYLTTLRNGHFVLGALRKIALTTLGLGSSLLAILDFLKSSFASSLTDLRALVTLDFDDLEGDTLDSLGGRGNLPAVSSALSLLLDALLVQTTVELGPRVLRGLTLHVERCLGLGVDEDVGAAI